MKNVRAAKKYIIRHQSLILILEPVSYTHLNQIGLATGYVKEIYHPDYVAKRMEIGAVIAAAPRSAVKRENSDPGDIIILLGGRTGRDGCGGATGSSKVHTEESIETCGAEVQKGNAPTERKMQRLFRRPDVYKRQDISSSSDCKKRGHT